MQNRKLKFMTDLSACVISFSVALFTVTCVFSVIYKSVTYAAEDIINYMDYLRDRRK